MAAFVTYGEHEYRQQGGEVHRRPADREGLSPRDAAWLVLNHGEDVPAAVRAQISEPQTALRFD